MKTSILDHLELAREFEYIKGKGFSHLTDLCRLMSSFGSDKGDVWHNYTIVYDWLFSRFRNEDLAVFELGIGTNKPGVPSSMGPCGIPGASLRGWHKYFPKAHIFGADIDRDILFQDDRIRTFWTDQRHPSAIRELWGELGNVFFDIMVDDGLHQASANICFFIGSFAKLKPGGIYVIEDIMPEDAQRMGSFVQCIAPVCKSIIYEELDHARNKIDNRLVILQKA